MIDLKVKGGFSKIENFFDKIQRRSRIGEQAHQVGSACVEELRRVTPKDSGLTADSWYYEVRVNRNVTTITFFNKNIQNGLNVALLLEYGHGTATGGWVEGKDYIDPVVRKNYVDAINRVWKEMVES